MIEGIDSLIKNFKLLNRFKEKLQMISCRLQSVISHLTNWKERNNFMEDTKTSILKKPGMKNEDEIRKTE